MNCGIDSGWIWIGMAGGFHQRHQVGEMFNSLIGRITLIVFNQINLNYRGAVLQASSALSLFLDGGGGGGELKKSESVGRISMKLSKYWLWQRTTQRKKGKPIKYQRKKRGRRRQRPPGRRTPSARLKSDDAALEPDSSDPAALRNDWCVDRITIRGIWMGPLTVHIPRIGLPREVKVARLVNDNWPSLGNYIIQQDSRWRAKQGGLTVHKSLGI